MIAQEMQNSDPSPTKSIWQELRESGLFPLAAIAVFLFAACFLVLWLLLKHGASTETLGQFGDAFGAVTALLNALAFAAVVATVVLQSRELRESRQELVKQAVAQQAWADAAARQIELTKQLESVRLRPFLKDELQLVAEETQQVVLSYWMRNVGLGVAIVTAIDLVFSDSRTRHIEVHSDKSQADEFWSEYILDIVGPNAAKFIRVELDQFDDRNRALAPDEKQEVIRVTVRANTVSEARNIGAGLKKGFRPIIYFQSVNGECYSTIDQFSP